MPKTTRATYLGFCSGVKRAIALSDRLLKEAGGQDIATLGPIIHNSRVVNSYSEKGLPPTTLEEAKKAKKVLICSHGVPHEKETLLNENGVELWDGTCPDVKKSQKLIEKYGKEGYTPFIVGDAGHAEVLSLKSYAPSHSPAVILATLEEAKKIEIIPKKSIIIAQTTISEKEFLQVASLLKEKNSNLIIKNTICPTTKKRQNAVLELTKKVDAILVIGDRKSSNSKRLFSIAQGEGVPTWQIENKEEIPEEIFNFDSVGITAGASTPETTICEIEEALK